MDGRVDKDHAVHTLEHSSATRKESLPSATIMDLEGVMLSETSQTEKGKHCTIYADSKKKKERERNGTDRNRLEWWSPEVGGG